MGGNTNTTEPVIATIRIVDNERVQISDGVTYHAFVTRPHVGEHVYVNTTRMNGHRLKIVSICHVNTHTAKPEMIVEVTTA